MRLYLLFEFSLFVSVSWLVNQFVETWPHTIAPRIPIAQLGKQEGFKLIAILLSQPLKFEDYNCESPHLTI